MATIAAVFILALGVVAALNRVEVATTVTTPVLVAILATIAGVVIVGVGGGLIKPMQTRWESYLSTAENQAPTLKEHAANAPSVKERCARPPLRSRTPTTPAGPVRPPTGPATPDGEVPDQSTRPTVNNHIEKVGVHHA